MLSGVSVSCFLLSYVLVFLMEASRFIFKIPGRGLLLVGMLGAGLAAHSIFLANEFMLSDTLMSNWFQWCVLGAWGLSAACLLLTIRNTESSIGLFLTPVVLGLIGLAQLVRGSEPFQPQTTVTVWRGIHGVSLLVGTMFICFGLAIGIMYLVKSYRLKNRSKKRRVLRLPPLEFLQSMNRLSLFATTIGLAFGLLSGIVLTVNRGGPAAWLNGSVVFTFALFASSLLATITELSSSGSLGGRKSAYLSIANFVFLAVVLLLMVVSSHGQNAEKNDQPDQAQAVWHLADRSASNGLPLVAGITIALPGSRRLGWEATL